MKTGILIVGHGSRDAAANAELASIIATQRARHPDALVAHAFLELAEPTLAPALHELARRVDRVVVVPLLLFAAGHVKNDVPLALERARRAAPHVPFIAARALGVHAGLVELAAARARAALGDTDPAQAALVVVGRGASDPDANAELCRLARLVGEKLGTGWVLPAFCGITTPKVEDALELAARTRPARLVVLPYLLTAGRLVEKLRTQVDAARARAPWLRAELAAHLGDDALLHDAIDERIAGALAGVAPLPCDTCQYRVPIGKVAEVGGLRALLWSVRHGVTHSQAMPHVHAHKPIRKHVLVCGNADCATRGSVALLVALRRHVRDAALGDHVRVTRTSCLGRCGEGPTVAVYPDGVWYRGVGAGDAGELVREHVVGDRLVARLVDQIVQ
ncbi:MAG TPA: CbiX/SirB N-terminal domain-containing protein [Kofleriaceae bacterium]|nr:CbiX/SirB N-terminal domain-containing protein [Kofleriaceae bacterium]